MGVNGRTSIGFPCPRCEAGSEVTNTIAYDSNGISTRITTPKKSSFLQAHILRYHRCKGSDAHKFKTIEVIFGAHQRELNF